MRRGRGLLAVAALGLVCLTVLVPAVAGAPNPPAIGFTPSSWDYGQVDPNTATTKTFQVRNNGGGATSEMTVSLAGSSAFTVTSDTCTGKSLGPNKTCTVIVQYAPTSGGSTDNATLTVSGNRTGVSASATVTGTTARPVSVTFNVTVPASTDGTGGSVHVDGWPSGNVTLTRADATHWTGTVTGTEGTHVSYVYTLGDSGHVERDFACQPIAPRELTLTYGASGTQSVNDTVQNWQNVAPCGA